MPSRSLQKDPERDGGSPRTKDRIRHKSSKTSRKSDKASSSSDQSPSRPRYSTKRKSSTAAQPESETHPSGSPNGSKKCLPYPAFSKAHSKETVGVRPEVNNNRNSYHTPDPTDLAQKEECTQQDYPAGKQTTPPSPPETTLDQKNALDTAKATSSSVERKRTDRQKSADELRRKLSRDNRKDDDRVKKRHTHSSRSRHGGIKEGSRTESRSASSSMTSKSNTPSKLRPTAVTVNNSEFSTSYRKTSSSVQSSKSQSTTDSDATSIAPHQPSTQRPVAPQAPHARRASPSPLNPDLDKPKTPGVTDIRTSPSCNGTPLQAAPISRAPSAVVEESPMPPPPPPAPSNIPVPRVDYLLQNGGLLQTIHRSLLSAGHQAPSSQVPPPYEVQAEAFFNPFTRVLDDYSKVIFKKGSLAVATGYRSVARRLLDRLETVFARDISSEKCPCYLCQTEGTNRQELDYKGSVSWGEVLEYVCGRQELPQWPVFVFDNPVLCVASTEQISPMQKLDIDVPEELREHYVRQSKRTKQTVDKWLETQPSDSIGPPNDVDDETLTFAMMTRLDADQRPRFSAILGVVPARSGAASPEKPAGSTISTVNSDLLKSTGLAIQRLYRLSKPPRDPESALYLLSYPGIHNVLATLAAISDGEWEILVSGRFDGFLRSGAEDDIPTPTVANVPNPLARSVSRNQPLYNRQQSAASFSSTRSPSRGPTPFASTPSPSAGAPVTLDEETEIAALAEVEREIFLGMEALEDAFEALHTKAESVRNALRERGAGLAQASQDRRGSNTGLTRPNSRFGTPASLLNGNGGERGPWESETDDGMDDGVSELAPDDSASNISRSRVRRPKRRNERRTPAAVEELDEE